MSQFGRATDPEHTGIRRWDDKPGGSASVSWRDTIGATDRCWCGHPAGHDWPGRAQGVPHPREAAS